MRVLSVVGGRILGRLTEKHNSVKKLSVRRSCTTVKARDSVSLMANNTTFEDYIAALGRYAAREGHTRVPISHTELDSAGRSIKLGTWVGYIRQRYRRGGLDESRAKILTGLPGWEWGPLAPGPRAKTSRDEEIRNLRGSGLSLQNIADSYGISRQRVHQIVTGGSK